MSGGEKIFFFFFAIFLTIYFTPFFGSHTDPITQGIILVLTFLASIRAFGLSSYNKFPRLFIAVVLWFSLALAYRAFGISDCSWNKILWKFFHLIVLLIGGQLVTHGSKPLMKYIILYVCAIFVLNTLDNIRLLMIYPEASEELNFDQTGFYQSLNVGGSTYANLDALMGLFFWVKSFNRYKFRAVFLSLFLLCWIYQFFALRAICVISFALGTLLIWVINYAEKKGIGARRRRYFFIFTLFAVLLPLLPWALMELSSLIGLERLALRLRALASILGYSDTSIDASSGTGRIELYLLSLSTFFNNFLFGIGEHPSELDKLISMGIGGHSTIFDSLAEYGLIGALFLIFLFVQCYQLFYKGIRSSRFMNGASSIIFCIYMFSSFLNNTFLPDAFTAVFILVPCTKLLFTQETQGRRVQLKRKEICKS